MKIRAYAKVNLTLRVLGVRADGYHALSSLVAPISLADELELTPAGDGAVTTDSEYGGDDLTVRAACALKRRLPEDARRLRGVKIHLEKHIPVGGGLGGGSADAAAVLLALNELWQLGLSPEALAELGAEVGSDVPALVLGQRYRLPIRMEGRGEAVAPVEWDAALREALGDDLPPSGPEWLVLANPGVNSSTRAVFAECRGEDSLEPAAVRLYPEIAAALSSLRRAGARGTRMSGSGATVFGFADSEGDARRLAASLASSGLATAAARLLFNGE